jgi:hypothetical protein
VAVVTLELMREFLLWCAVINIVFLLVSFVMIILAKDLIYRIHGTWFKLTPEQFDRMWYGLLGTYKLGVFLFNIVPWLALLIIG